MLFEHSMDFLEGGEAVVDVAACTATVIV